MKKLLSILLLGALYQLQALAPFSGTIGAGSGYYIYEEPSIMSVKGLIYGISGNLSTRLVKFEDLWMDFGQEIVGNYHKDVKQLNYEGGLVQTAADGSKIHRPHLTTSTDMWYDLSYRLGIGFSSTYEYDDFLYIGAGYRYLRNKLEGAGSYTREQEYQYIPIGYKLRTAFGENSFIGIRAEYLFLLKGNNTTHLQELGYSSSPYFLQTGGEGLRFELSYDIEIMKVYSFIKITYENWKIDDSNVIYVENPASKALEGYLEPRNTTNQIMLYLGLGF